jgi:hypothetical protein
MLAVSLKGEGPGDGRLICEGIDVESEVVVCEK